MNTDNKAVARWDIESQDGRDCLHLSREDGDYVLFTDHERVVGELDERAVNMKSWARHDREMIEVLETEIETLRTTLAASRAEVEGLKKDAERWGHARKLLTTDDISKRQRELDAWQNLVSEEECELADKAIDAAMKEQAE